mgnify:CR=1 FL=1
MLLNTFFYKKLGLGLMSMSSFLKFALFYSECFLYSYTLIRNR